ncbi:MAG: hypothetical protein NTW71_05915 [Deltaproteobacteria bacterium]|nr:hypothetical protein [Deltaproteobacteria bacterium]
MEIVNPSKLEEIKPPFQANDTSNEDKYLYCLCWWFNRIANTVFIPLEFLLGVSIYVFLLIYGYKIFICYDPDYIMRAKSLIEFINTNWIGFLFIPPLIFFRLIIIKITNLKDAKGVAFSEETTIYRTGK